MKVCLIFPAYPPAESERGVTEPNYVRRLALCLADNGLDVVVITSKVAGREPVSFPYQNVTVYSVVNDWSLRGVHAEFSSVRELLRRLEVDAINVVYPDTYLRDRYFLPYVTKMLYPRGKLITTLFQFVPRRSSLLYKAVAPLLYLASDALHFHDEGLMDVFKRLFPFMRNKAEFIPVGSTVSIEHDRFINWSATDRKLVKSKLGIPTDSNVISFVGYWYRNKGVDTLFRAFALLLRRRANVRLLLVGGRPNAYADSFEQEMWNLVDSLRIGDFIVSTGFTSDEDFLSYLACSDICAFPLRSNITGRSSLMAAVSLRIPCVVSRPTGPSSLLVDRENCLFAPSDDPAALADAMDELLGNEHLRNTIATNLNDLAARTDWRNIGHEWVRLYKRLLI